MVARMSKLVAIAYPDAATAGDVAQTLMERQLDHLIELDDLVVAVRKNDGRIRLLLMPLLGAAIGGATAVMTDVGVDDEFVKELSAKLKPGGAAVFVLVRRSTPDKVLPRISQYGGEVIHCSLSEEAEETLREALREGAPA
jgi:uncharacterized membrane protein